DGGVTGLFMGIVNLKSFAFAVPSLISIPQFINKAASANFINALIVLMASFVITFVLTWLFGIDEEPEPVAATATPVAETPDDNVASGSQTTTKIYSPMAGEVINLDSVADATFAQKMLGDGVAIIPQDGKIYAPFAGTVMTVFPTKHAIGLKSDSGVELLIHCGLDTVNLKGAPFTQHVQTDQRVAQGELLMEADLEQIKQAGYDTTTPLVVTNTKDFVAVEATDKTVVTKDDVALYVI
ncbi:MAG: glucose PTS transporter subunit IIA, partial [Loigolactobacillus coryniformis]|nr:glucose PTS transporter subunit IIA [Loigolactobacillus coryniformis]